MSFKKNFCSSPWFHMRITNSGTYEPCRWMKKSESSRVNFDRNIQTVSPLTYFQNTMSQFRLELLQGQAPDLCSDCRVMEQHGKPSGRQRQLLKAGIQGEFFEKSLASSPLRAAFDHSNNSQGNTTHLVSDWQIDLGNYCNGACVFCHPESSSSLATEFKKIGLLDQMPPPSWCDDPESLDQFIEVLLQNTDFQFLHFIGGETLITPGFKKILSALIDAGLAKKICIGFTTNLTVWSDSVVELLKQFYQVHLGMSVETLTPINDYVRYPSQQARTKELLDRWVELGKQQDWLIHIRITPTCLTIHDLTTVYDYAWQNNTAVESSNFIDRPKFFRIGVLPKHQRTQAAQTLQRWIEDHPAQEHCQIINTRDPNITQAHIIQDAQSYLNYLDSADDESYRLPDLVTYLKQLENNRGNTILTYLPQYEELFRSAGY